MTVDRHGARVFQVWSDESGFFISDNTGSLTAENQDRNHGITVDCATFRS